MSSRSLKPVEKWRRRLGHKPEVQRYLELVYARFKATGEWPNIRTLQRELVLGDDNFDAFGAAAAIPRELGSDPSHFDGLAKLTILAVALCPGSEPDVQAFVGFLQLCVTKYKEEDDPRIAESSLNELLQIDNLGVRRLTKLVEWEPFVWRENVNDIAAFGLRQDLIHHFANAQNLDDYLTAKGSLQGQQPRYQTMSVEPGAHPFPVETYYPVEVGGGPHAPTPGPWKPRAFRLFASHLAKSKQLVGDVKQGLEPLAIDLFVAHADILPSREWERTILDALATCDAIALFLVDGFRASDWTDQEFGFALARDVHVIPINLGIQPYGFAKRFQSLPAQRLDSLELADAIFDVLVNGPKTAGRVAEAVVTAIVDASSIDEALKAAKLLGRLSHWTPGLIAQLEEGLVENDSIAQSVEVSQLINNLIHADR